MGGVIRFPTVRSAWFVRLIRCVPGGSDVFDQTAFRHPDGRPDPQMADGVSVDKIVGAVSADIQSLADLRDGHYVR